MQTQHYNLQHLLGQGGMAKVYLAEHKTLGHKVAIKVLNREYVHNENIRKRFLAEAKNLARMNHSHVVRVMDFIEDGNMVAFVMEYIDGQTLRDYLDQKGKLPDDEIKRLFGQMLEAVAYVHEQGLVHRDIKPSNFMLDNRGNIKLLDFGIAKTLDSSSAEYTQTATSQHMGTPMYMSPEQVKSTKNVTAQSDIYSLGVVLWQMAAGRKPYDTSTLSTFEIQVKIVNEPLPETGSKWDGIIKKATEKDLKKRILLEKDAVVEIWEPIEKLNVNDKSNFTKTKIESTNQPKNDFEWPNTPFSNTHSKFQLNPNLGRAKAVKAALWILFSILLMTWGLFWFQAGSLGSNSLKREDYEALEALLWISKSICLIASATLFIRWEMRAVENLGRVLRKSEMKYDSYDAWTWWLVPIWWLWKPFQVVKFIYLSYKRLSGEKTPSLILLRFWWLFWLLGFGLMRFSFVEFYSLIDGTEDRDAAFFLMIWQMLDFIGIPLAAKVVNRVSTLESVIYEQTISQ